MKKVLFLLTCCIGFAHLAVRATDLHNEVSVGDIAHVDDLLRAGSNINAQNEDGETALHLAVLSNNEPIARLLLERNADRFLQDRDGNTPFHLAVRDNRVNMAALLLEYHADNNIPNKVGYTPSQMFDLYTDSLDVYNLWQDWPEMVQQRNAARLAVCLAGLPRTGAGSQLSSLGALLIAHIAQFLHPLYYATQE